MIWACLYAFVAKGTFLNIKFRHGPLLVPYYCLIFTAVETLTAVDTAGITLLSARNIPKWFIVAEKGDLGPCRNQLNKILRALGEAEAAAGTLLRVDNGYAVLWLYRYCTLRTYLYTVSETQTGMRALLVSAEKLDGCLAGLNSRVIVYNL